MKKTLIVAIAAISLSLLVDQSSHAALGSGGPSGMVTPSTMSITVTNISLIRPDGSYIAALSGSYKVTFNRTDADFAKVSLASANVPQGRFVGVYLEMEQKRDVLLNGNTYYGSTDGGFVSGTTKLYTVAGKTGDQAGSISTTGPTGTLISGVAKPGSTAGAHDSSKTFFATPVCLGATNAKCATGDTFVSTATAPQITLMMDLYDSLVVDATDLQVAFSGYPIAVLGGSGAAIHLMGSYPGITGGVIVDATLMFSPTKQLLWTSLFSAGHDAGMRVGFNGVLVTGGPSGVTIPTKGTIMAISSFDSTTGAASFPLSSECEQASCSSRGLVTLDNVLQAVGSTVNFACAADTTGGLGFTYTGGSCPSVNTGQYAYKVKRIIDPSNIFGICTSGFVAGTTGTCADPADSVADGYN